MESFDGGCSTDLESWRREHGQRPRPTVVVPADDGTSALSATDYAKLRVEQGIGESDSPYFTKAEVLGLLSGTLSSAGRAGRGAAWAAMDLEDRVAALEVQIADLAGQLDELTGRVEALEGAGGD